MEGRGGSVSRRDHNQAVRNRATLQAEPTKKKDTRQTPAALRERGSGGEALLSEKRPLPQNFPTVHLFGREREGGGFSQRSPFPRKLSRPFLPYDSALGLETGAAEDDRVAVFVVLAVCGQREGADAVLKTGAGLFLVFLPLCPR